MQIKKHVLSLMVILFGLSSMSVHSDALLNKNKKSFNKRIYIKTMLENYHNENMKFTIEDLTLKQNSIDSVFKKLASHNQFNGCVLVAQYGQIVYKNSFGLANPILNEPLRDNSIFQLASVSKTITAVSILQLIEQNLIGVDDYIGHYLPAIPYPQITIKQLLTHRSGIPNYIGLDSRFYTYEDRYLNNEDAYKALCAARLPLNFTPGSRFVYNNSNYALLALIVEKVSGLKFPEYVKKNIFEPLDMKNSYISQPDHIWSKENRTFGLYANNKIHPNDRFDGVFGDKGAYSTVEDMYKFDRSLYPNVLLTKSTLDMAFTNYVIEPNGTKKYGLGFRMREDQNKQKIIFHNGWWHGYRTAFHRRETDNSCVIILSNRLNTVVYAKAKELFYILDKYSPSKNNDDAEHNETED